MRDACATSRLRSPLRGAFAFACVVVLGVTVAEIVGDLPNYSSWLAASMASGYAISGSV